MKNNFYKNVILTLVSLAFIGSVRFVFNLVIARNFDKATLGVASISLSTALIFTTFFTTFFGPSASKFLAEYRGSDQREPFVLVKKIVLFGPFVVLIPLEIALYALHHSLAGFLGIPRVAYFFMSAFIVVRVYYMVLRNIFYGIDWVERYTVVEIVGDLIFFSALCAIALLGRGDWVLLSYVAGYASFCALSTYYVLNLHRYIAGTLPSVAGFQAAPVVKRFMKFSSFVALGSVASIGAEQAAILVTGMYLAKPEVGVYSATSSVTSVFLFVPMAVAIVMMPEISRQYGAGKTGEIIKTLNTSTQYLVLLGLFLVGAVLIAPEKVMLIFGRGYASGVSALSILLLGVFMNTACWPAIQVLIGTKYVIYPNIGGVIALLTSLGSWPFLIPRYGVVGTAVGFSLGVMLGGSFSLFMAQRFYPLDYRPLLRIAGRNIFLVAVMIILKKRLSILGLPSVMLAFIVLFLFFNLHQLRRMVHQFREAFGGFTSLLARDDGLR